MIGLVQPVELTSRYRLSRAMSHAMDFISFPFLEGFRCDLLLELLASEAIAKFLCLAVFRADNGSPPRLLKFFQRFSCN